MSMFVHPQGLCESSHVGDNTRIWAFAHVLPGARVGADCNICDHVFIENAVQIGDRVTIKCGVQLWDGTTIEDDVFIGPNATFTNDAFPRSKRYQQAVAHTLVKTGASIGANATILPGLTIGSYAMIGAGAVVLRSVPDNAIVAGNPALIVGYVDAGKPERMARPSSVPAALPDEPIRSTRVRGVTVHRLPFVEDMRGNLTVGEFERSVPFAVKRYFMVLDVPSAEVRGEHAHRVCHQFMICARGSVSVVADDGAHREELVLNVPWLGIHLPPMVWGVQYRYSKDAVFLVFASEHYDNDDYIRDYAQFLAEVATR
jgi:acetyltransferase-like isoleucine patch superfamily enzyme/dTDP-4-dehydrorhamnose 3,5-epimerase-like enzyme